MSDSVASTHLPPLGEPVRHEVGIELQATLVELIDLALVGKQLHWSVVGPMFRPVHLHLDELVASWRDLADTVAERSSALDQWPDGQAGAVAKSSELAALEPGSIRDREVIRELAQRIEDVAERCRTRMDRLGELDAVSQDVLVQVVGSLEQQLWMVRTQLDLGEGR